MHVIIRFSLVPLVAVVLMIGVSPRATAQDTPEARARERRATLTVYEDIDGALRAAVRGYAEAQPNPMEGEFVRSSYWRQGDTVYAIVKARLRVTIPIEGGVPMKELLSSLRERYASEEGLLVAPTDDVDAAIVQYERYLFAGNVAGSWEAFDAPTGLTSNPAVQERALLEMEVARRQEKYLGKR